MTLLNDECETIEKNTRRANGSKKGISATWKRQAKAQRPSARSLADGTQPLHHNEDSAEPAFARRHVKKRVGQRGSPAQSGCEALALRRGAARRMGVGDSRRHMRIDGVRNVRCNDSRRDQHAARRRDRLLREKLTRGAIRMPQWPVIPRPLLSVGMTTGPGRILGSRILGSCVVQMLVVTMRFVSRGAIGVVMPMRVGTARRLRRSLGRTLVGDTAPVTMPVSAVPISTVIMEHPGDRRCQQIADERDRGGPAARKVRQRHGSTRKGAHAKRMLLEHRTHPLYAGQALKSLRC